MGILDYFLLALVGACAVLAVLVHRKAKKNGGCCGNCGACRKCSNAK